MTDQAPRVAIVMTSCGVIEATGGPTGAWDEEVAAPYHVFTDAGAEVSLWSVNGGQAPIDPMSRLPEWQTDATRRFDEVRALLADTRPVAELGADAFEILYLPGGLGTMWDTADHPPLTRLIEAAFASGRQVVCSVCHGPVALVSAHDAQGAPLVRGRRLTAYTNAEEKLTKTDTIVPFALETRLRDLGAVFQGGADFAEVVVEDGMLVTGQNPASSRAAAEAALAAFAALRPASQEARA